MGIIESETKYVRLDFAGVKGGLRERVRQSSVF